MSVTSSSRVVPRPYDEFSSCLRRAYDDVGQPAASAALRRCEFVLEMLPLSTSEFALMRNRLRNALRYSALQERGAARYELRLLLHALLAAA